MISSLEGTIKHKGLNVIMVDVGGIGYKVAVTTETALGATAGSPVFLWTHLVVRETALELYGFLDKETLDIFELLITISGILVF
jgi:holliday junction DNA helicase RuvA